MLRPYSGKPKRGSKRHMTSMEKGLARSAHREGMSILQISLALKRDPMTIRRLLKMPSTPATTESILQESSVLKSPDT